MHSISLSKLEHYRMGANAFEELESYVTNRVQYVIINSKISNPFRIRHCIPQGSVLEPLLFFHLSMIFENIANSTICR